VFSSTAVLELKEAIMENLFQRVTVLSKDLLTSLWKFKSRLKTLLEIKKATFYNKFPSTQPERELVPFLEIPKTQRRLRYSARVLQKLLWTTAASTSPLMALKFNLPVSLRPES
jgi:hypothetical protein